MPGELLRGLLKTLKRQKAELLREAFEDRALRKLYDGYTINPEQQLRHITTLIHLLEFIYPCRALKAHHIDRATQQALFFSIDSASIQHRFDYFEDTADFPFLMVASALKRTKWEERFNFVPRDYPCSQKTLPCVVRQIGRKLDCSS